MLAPTVDSNVYGHFETARSKVLACSSALVSLPGIVMVCVAPCRSRKTGCSAVIGEELILPLSDLGERFPLTRTSQLPPPWTSVIQQQVAYLDRNDNKHIGQHGGAVYVGKAVVICML